MYLCLISIITLHRKTNILKLVIKCNIPYMFHCSTFVLFDSYEALREILISTYSPNKKEQSIYLSVFHAKRTRLPFFCPTSLGWRAVKKKQLLLGQASGYCLPAAAAYFLLLQTAVDAWISRAGRSGLCLLGSLCCFNFSSLSF